MKGLTLAALAVLLVGCGVLDYRISKKQIDRYADVVRVLIETSEDTDPAAPVPAAPVPVPERPSGGDDRFLWKPISQNDGRLVVLFPAKYRGRIDSAGVYTQGGDKIESGRFAGDSKNGGRPHYRFSKPGGGFGRDVRAIANLKDGGQVIFDIADGAERVEK